MGCVSQGFLRAPGSAGHLPLQGDCHRKRGARAAVWSDCAQASGLELYTRHSNAVGVDSTLPRQAVLPCLLTHTLTRLLQPILGLRNQSFIMVSRANVTHRVITTIKV